MRRVAAISFLAAVVGLLGTSRAMADSIDTFTYNFAGNTFAWDLPASPVPDGSLPGYSFEIDNVSYSENGVPEPPEIFTFFSLAEGGGFAVGENLILDAYGEQLYSPTESVPTFLTGTYELANGGPDGPLGTLVISSTPEPTSLLLLGTGMLALSGILKKRRA
jgi:hypothetical protein